MFGFSVNRPTDLQSIEGALSSYATPEAAEADLANAPHGRDYLNNQYQRLTGDYFANPINDFFKGHTDDMVQAAMNGSSVATGSNSGMRILPRATPSPAILPPPNSTVPAVQPFSSLAPLTLPNATAPATPAISPNLSPLGNKEVANSLITQMLQGQGRNYQLAGSDVQIPTAEDSPFTPLPIDVIKRRASLAGVSNELARINPRSVNSPIDESDPRFARTQAGKAIGMDIHPLAYDDNFQEIARRDPGKANALYHAVTNRNYDTDVKAKSQLLVEQRDARKKIIEGIKHLEANEVTGALFKQVEHYDSFGGTKLERVALTPLEKAAVEAEGGDSIKRIYGIDLPNRGGLPKIPGMTPEGHTEYVNTSDEIRKQHPDWPVSQVTQQALATMKDKQNKDNAPISTRLSLKDRLMRFNPNDITAKMVNANLVAPANILNQILNVPSRSVNAMSSLLGSNFRAATIPSVPYMDSGTISDQEIKTRGMLAEWLKKKSEIAGTAYAGQ